MALYTVAMIMWPRCLALRMSATRGQINCKTVSKLRPEKFKNTMPYKPWYSGYHGNKQTWWPLFLFNFFKFMSGTFKESNCTKFEENSLSRNCMAAKGN